MSCSLGPGVEFSSGGIDKPYGSWKRSDGTSIMCWKYWQSTLQFVANGLTVNSYPAHCTVYTYVKGEAAKVSINGQQILPHGSKMDACLGSADNIDVGVQRIYLG